MLTLKTAIEKINEYEEENYKLQEQVEFFQRKSQRLEKRNKEIYDGFMASNQELCDNAKEISRLNNIIDELEESIESSVKVSGLNIKIATEKEIKEKYFYLKHELEMLLLELKKLKEGK